MDDDKSICRRKLAFTTKQEALGQARNLKWLRGSRLSPYHCQVCGLWHLATERNDDEAD